MNVIKTGFLALCVFFLCAGTASAAYIDVTTFNDGSEYERSFTDPELQTNPATGHYEALFSDIFTFTLTESGSLEFTLEERDSRGFFADYVDIINVAFVAGPAPSRETAWIKNDPAFTNNENKFKTFAWAYLDAGTYQLSVMGKAVGESYPSTTYWMKEVTFQKGTNPNPVPEPATMLMLGAGLLGLAGRTRIQRKK